jgi:glycosyltransferase involved in cell wall biosynthesis
MNKEKLLSNFYFLDKLISKKWKPFSKLMIRGDGSDWVLSSIAKELKKIMPIVGIETINNHYYYNISNQSVFFTSKYEVLNEWPKINHRIAFPYFHGMPENGDQFKLMFDNISKYHQSICRIQVSHTQMQKKILETGINSEKIFKIPISINLDLFKRFDSARRLEIRKFYGIPENSLVIGSFQKDGVGWKDGKSPKLIKGPDIFIKVIKELKRDFPNLFVLLSGPSRGYVKENLQNINVPFKHIELKNYNLINLLYNCLDLYIVTSREEGGPRSILESMASGVPIVSTKVGQATDLIQHGVNGWLTEISDVSSLVSCSKDILNNPNSLDNVLENSLIVAKNNSYMSQINLWKKFMGGFIE